ncbi:antitoxin [Adlercreutzia sp. R21]|uniref:Antitoxin n=1 Tax=Adlercreutzia wanghongyangiae TaxID=3111451 RepID=A0ABU6IJN2_9ACTN|nr:antitoxin [Adlercreutzia sp. R21]MEC4176670.1 antitoxin [Adlercreutzia sp. R7]MEC4183661.1 antitoxin [Adlercreutzia sp. R21]
MSATMTVRPPQEIQDRYAALARATGRPRSFYINRALEDSIDELEEIYGVLHDLEEYRAGRLKALSADEARSACGL